MRARRFYLFLFGNRRPEIVPLSMDEIVGYQADGGRMDALIYTHYSIDAPPVYTSPVRIARRPTVA
jgi:hypothetical protein